MRYRTPADIPDSVSVWFRAKGLEAAFTVAKLTDKLRG